MITVLATALGEPVASVRLATDSLHDWDAYTRAARLRMENRLSGEKPFLWAQESEQRMSLLRAGAVLAEPIAGSGRTVVSGGLIHDWIGAVFVPGVTAGQVFSKLDSYENYKDFYWPTVVESRLLARDGDTCRFSMRWQKRISFVTDVIDADYESSYSRPQPDRWWSISRSTRIQEVEHYGRPDERLKPVGTGQGYIWRLYSITRVQEADHGAVIELEAIALSREIPSAVAWLVNPIVNRTSRNALLTTLTQTRAALQP